MCIKQLYMLLIRRYWVMVDKRVKMIRIQFQHYNYYCDIRDNSKQELIAWEKRCGATKSDKYRKECERRIALHRLAYQKSKGNIIYLNRLLELLATSDKKLLIDIYIKSLPIKLIVKKYDFTCEENLQFYIQLLFKNLIEMEVNENEKFMQSDFV